MYISDKVIVWSLSGGSVKFVALVRGAKVSIAYGRKPHVIVGVSAGALLAPIIALAYQDPCILEEAIELAETLDMTDMFPIKGNKPFTEKGNIAPGAYLRVVTGWNHLGWQDIAPLYKKVMTEERFKLFKKTDINCWAFGVKGRNMSPKPVLLNNASSVDELIQMIELSSRMTPLVQPAPYKGDTYVDGGFISHSAFWWIKDKYNVEELITFYTSEYSEEISDNSNWDKSLFTVVMQLLLGTTHWLSMHGRDLEELYCHKHNIKHMRMEFPGHIIDEIYDTDDEQLKALGDISEEIAVEAWELYNGILN